MEKLIQILSEFPTVSLDEMENAKLMNRVDTKFAFHENELPEILEELKTDYNVLEVNNNRISLYESLYFDKNKFDFYLDHHNRKQHRFKVRFRKYVETEKYFLEIKEKYKGRTIKKRIPVTGYEESLSSSSKEFIHKHIPDNDSLQPKLWNQYERITLVSNDKKERLTFDLNLKFEWQKETKSFPSLVISELKQLRHDRSSPFYKLMRSKGIRPYRLSKYCIGTVELYDSSRIKYNRFKKKLLKLKLINDAT